MTTDLRAEHGWLELIALDPDELPTVKLRLARLSGDRPDTPCLECRDPLLAAGSDEWMGCIAFSKVRSDTLLVQDRVRAFAAPAGSMASTLDLPRYRADESNNLGAGPLGAVRSAFDIGHKVMAIIR